MNQWKRVIYYLLLNIIVSAITTTLVLFVWDRTHPRSTQNSASAGQLFAEALSASATVASLQATGAAQAILQATPTMDENVIEYQVEADDTLGIIAAKYGVTVDQIMAVNGFTDPDAVSAGLIIYIPVKPEISLTSTPAPTSMQVAVVFGTPIAGKQTAKVLISSVIGAGDINAERVFITRTGSGVLSLAGWKLLDSDGNAFNFPQLEMYENGAVNVWTMVGTPSVVDLYWGLQDAVWQPGETVTLIDAQGNTQAVYQVP